MKALWAERRRGYERFAEWERTQRTDRPAADVIADLGALREWLPRESRNPDNDPDYAGLQYMRQRLSTLQ